MASSKQSVNIEDIPKALQTDSLNGDEEEEVDTDTELHTSVHLEMETMNKSSQQLNDISRALQFAKKEYVEFLQKATLELRALHKTNTKALQNSKPFYDVYKEARELTARSRQAATCYERASQRHQAAKAVVGIAEGKLMEQAKCEGGVASLDPAWQEALSDAVTRVNATEIEKRESEEEHYRLTFTLRHVMERYRSTELKLRKHIRKAHVYYERRAELAGHAKKMKERIQQLEVDHSGCRKSYHRAMRNLEDISNSIHRKRTMSSTSSAPRTPSHYSFSEDVDSVELQAEGVGLRLGREIRDSDEYIHYRPNDTDHFCAKSLRTDDDDGELSFAGSSEQEVRSRSQQETRPISEQEIRPISEQEIRPASQQEVRPRSQQEVRPRSQQVVGPRSQSNVDNESVEVLNDLPKSQLQELRQDATSSIAHPLATVSTRQPDRDDCCTDQTLSSTNEDKMSSRHADVADKITSAQVSGGEGDVLVGMSSDPSCVEQGRTNLKDTTSHSDQPPCEAIEHVVGSTEYTEHEQEITEHEQENTESVSGITEHEQEITEHEQEITEGSENAENEHGNTESEHESEPKNNGSEHENAESEQENTESIQENTGPEQANTESEQENTGSEQENTESKQENSGPEQENTESEQENTGPEQENTESEQENSGPEQENTESEQENTESEQENAGLEQENTESEQENTEYGQQKAEEQAQDDTELSEELSSQTTPPSQQPVAVPNGLGPPQQAS